MAAYFAEHDFLVRPGSSPETDRRETVATVLVGQGTTPNVVVEQALAWISANSVNTSYDITWFTAGSLVPATLRTFRFQHINCAAAAQVFLFPGRVDHEIEAVSGPEPVDFAMKLKRCFKYAFLSAHSFDISNGSLSFHFSAEIPLQRAMAGLYAAQKFLFLDQSKFRREGEYGYSVRDLLLSSEAVTIYTVSSSLDSWIIERFRSLCDDILAETGPSQPGAKTLRLVVVGRDGPTDHVQYTGTVQGGAGP